jgi:hypothetical protein
VAVQAPRELGSERRIIGGEQARAEIGGADPAAGVDARADDKAEMISVDRLVYPGDSRQCGEAGVGRPPGDLDPLRDQRPVDPREGDDIADRAERYQIQPAEEVGLGAAAAVPARLAQRAVDRDDEQKGGDSG